MPGCRVRVQIVIQEQQVCQMNEATAATGILPGCTLATAYNIRSELTYFERNPSQEQERLADLAQALYRYSSVVSHEPQTVRAGNQRQPAVVGKRRYHRSRPLLSAQT